jgi:hypothetical protein
MKFFNFFLLLWVIFSLLDPDSESGSGSTDPIESGSNPDPDPQPCLKNKLIFLNQERSQNTLNFIDFKSDEKVLKNALGSTGCSFNWTSGSVSGSRPAGQNDPQKTKINAMFQELSGWPEVSP